MNLNNFQSSLSECINILKNNILAESKRDDLLLPYLDILNKRGDNCTLSQLKGFLLKKFSNEFGIHALSESSNYYLAGVTRYYFEGLITTNKRLNIMYPKVTDKPIQQICEQLDKLIIYLRNSYIDSVGTKFEQPEDFGKLSLDKLLKKYNKKINPQVEVKEEEPNKDINIYEGSINDYTYKIIYDFEEAKPYSKYTQPGAWCITYGQQHYNGYIKKLNIHYIFFLKNGFENVPRQVGQGYTKRKPHDEYGNSMIAVLQSNTSPKPIYITSRWNHGYGETSGTEADHAYTEEEFLNIIGADSSILEQCFNQWQEGIKQLKKDSKSVNTEKRQSKLTALRKFKYAQMRLNEGARIKDVFTDGDDDYIDNINRIDGSFNNLDKGLFFVSLKGSDNSKWTTIMDRRTLLFDKFFINTNDSMYSLPTGIKYNDFMYGILRINEYIMLYNRKKRSFVDANGIIKFKHYDGYALTRENSEYRYYMLAKSGNEICLFDKVKGQMVKAPNGATVFESIVPILSTSAYMDDSNTDYSGHIRLHSIDKDCKFIKLMYDSAANLYFIYSTETNSFINLPKEISTEGYQCTARGQHGFVNNNLIKFSTKISPNTRTNHFKLWNVTTNSWFEINGVSDFSEVSCELYSVLSFKPINSDDIFHYNFLKNKFLTFNGETLIGKRTMYSNEGGKWVCISSKSPIECTKYWQVLLYNPEYDIYYQDNEGNYLIQIYGNNVDYSLEKQGYCGTYTKENTDDEKHLLPTAEKYVSELNQIKENIKKNFNLILEKIKGS